MLRPSRPMMRPFISSDGRWTTRHRVLGGVVRGHALHRGQDDVAGLVLGLLARGALDGAAELDGVVLGLGADGLEEHRLGVLGATCPRRARGRRPARRIARVSSSLDFSSSRSRSRSLRSRLSSISARWSSCSSRWTRRRSCAASSPRRARASSSASRAEAQLLVLRLEDQLLLAGAGFGLDAAGLGLRRLHALGCPHAAGQCAEYGSADGGHNGHRHEDRCVHRLSSHPDRIMRPDASRVRWHDRDCGR